MRVLGITLGDVTGIGPEVTIKALSEPGSIDAALVLIADRETIRRSVLAAEWPEIPPIWPGRGQATPGIWQMNPGGEALPAQLECGDARAARAALAWLQLGARLSYEREFDGMVTAPVNKEAILRTGVAFVGQTEGVTQLAGSPATGMMLLGTDERGRWLRVLLATTHLPLRAVPEAITGAGLKQSLQLADRACRQLGLARRRIAVCGLNPHAGEGGYLGREEIDVIRPAVTAGQEAGFEVTGPYAADTLFHRAVRGDFEVVLAMYHDQGLGPLKLVAFDTGVNWTVGLPFVRTSPDHGTAYEIAGKGLADSTSMKAAIRLALQLVGSV